MHTIYKSVRQDYKLMIENYLKLMSLEDISEYAYNEYKTRMYNTFKKIDIVNRKIAKGLN